MNSVKRIVLDVLKPHQPNALSFASSVADIAPGYRILLKVLEVDEKTETVMVTVEGESVDYEAIEKIIGDLGGSIHSIDEVLVEGKQES